MEMVEISAHAILAQRSTVGEGSMLHDGAATVSRRTIASPSPPGIW